MRRALFRDICEKNSEKPHVGHQRSHSAIPTPQSPAVEACKRDRRGDILAYGIMALFFYIVTLVFIVVIMKVSIDPVIMTLVTMVVGAVTTGAALVLNFQFGSSQGSQDKNATIAAATPPPLVIPAAPPTKVIPGPATGIVIQPQP